MKIGYIRVSTREQNIARQEVLMEQLGVDKVYIDKISGKNTNRPQLHKMLEELQPGDTVIVEAISRFARNTKDLLYLVDVLTGKDVEFISKKENMDTTTPQGRFMLTIFGACAELERESILGRQREGIEIRKAAGGYTGENHKGKKRVEIDQELFKSLMPLYFSRKITAQECADQLGVSKYIFYRRVKEWKSEHSCNDKAVKKASTNHNTNYERGEKLRMAIELDKKEKQQMRDGLS